MKRVPFCGFLFLCLSLASGSNIAGMAARPRLVKDCRVEINGREYAWDDIGRFVLAGDTLWLAIHGEEEHSGWVASAGELTEVGGRTFWVAPPEPGLYPLIASAGSTVKTVNVFVMVPATELRDGCINGFRIGKYERTPPFPNFDKPRGFIELTEENAGTKVSPRYKLGDFAPKLQSGFPKYMILREELLVKLELLSDLVRSKGYTCERLSVLSGYRTPAGHRSGASSAHCYGGAADVYIDCNNDGHLDDLNRDGESSSKDSRILAGYVDELEALHPELVGGCGWYRRTSSRGPFIHTDVRGERTRWHR